jgi:RimJ/RimL family protein N-acetyltransferase
MRIISAPPLVLEPQVPAHAHDMFAVLSDPAIYEFENEPPISEEALTARYARLESRQSPDGTESWLNWVIRLPTGELAGYVQATVLRTSGVALVAYEIGSKHWRQGIGGAAVAAVLDELRLNYAVKRHAAVLKAKNYRSLGLLRKLGFREAAGEECAQLGGAADEVVMLKVAL